MSAMSARTESAIVMDLESESLVQRDRWKPLLHKKQGFIEWEPNRFMPYRTEHQLDGTSALSGRYLFNEVKTLPILNGNAVCFLKKHQHLIPKHYRSLELLAWGTIYYERTAGREPFVRGLYWNGSEWEETDVYVNGFGFTAKCAALMYVHPNVKAHGSDARL